MEAGEVAIRVERLATPRAKAVAGAGPLTSTASTWGEEVYFATAVIAASEPDARDVMELGDVAYWPPGKAVAIGFGPTPVSRGDEIRLASPSNVFGRALDDVRRFRAVRPGAAITLSIEDA